MEKWIDRVGSVLGYAIVVYGVFGGTLNLSAGSTVIVGLLVLFSIRD